MNIWLVTIGEPIPHAENKLRLHRTGILAKYISENSNHEVTWWTSAFNHFTKESIFPKTKSFNVNNKLKIIAIKGKGYKKNVSFDRIIDHAQVAKEFSFLSKNERVPDIIVASFPTLGLCNAANKFAKANSIPLLIDYRDLWPEVFTDLLPNKIQFLGKIALFELFRRTNKVFKQADGIIGITKPYLQIALDKIKRQINKNDAVFPLAYLKNQFSEIEYKDAEKFWEIKNDPLILLARNTDAVISSFDSSALLDGLYSGKPSIEFFRSYKDKTNFPKVSLHQIVGISVSMTKKNIKELMIKALFKPNDIVWKKQKKKFNKIYSTNKSSTNLANKVILKKILK